MASTRMMSGAVLNLIKSGTIHENAQKCIFYINLNSHCAQVEFERDGDTYDLVHTSIPDEFQGQGLGTVFAERIFDHLAERNKKIKLTCEFLENFYSKNVDKYKQFVVESNHE